MIPFGIEPRVRRNWLFSAENVHKKCDIQVSMRVWMGVSKAGIRWIWICRNARKANDETGSTHSVDVPSDL